MVVRWLGCAATFLAIQLVFLDFACAEMIHLEPDTLNSEIKATVTEPLNNFRDHPTTTGTFRILTGEIDGDPKNVAATGRVKLIIDATTYESGSLDAGPQCTQFDSRHFTVSLD